MRTNAYDSVKHTLLAYITTQPHFEMAVPLTKDTRELGASQPKLRRGLLKGVTLSCDLQDQWDSIKLQGEGDQEESTPNILCKCQHMKIKSGQMPCLSDKGSKETILVVFANLSETQTYRKVQ